jgi:hypothetical protein
VLAVLHKNGKGIAQDHRWFKVMSLKHNLSQLTELARPSAARWAGGLSSPARDDLGHCCGPASVKGFPQEVGAE